MESLENINNDIIQPVYNIFDGKWSKLSPYLNKDENYIITKPFVDIHTHGCLGYDFCTSSDDELSLMENFYLKNGILYVLPTLVAMKHEDYKMQIKRIINHINKNSPFVGLNLEGPFLNPIKKGAINEKYICNIDIDFAKELWEISEGNIKIMTVAPELNGFEKLVEFAKGKFHISLGHTNANYDCASNAITKLGINHITHIFNAMNSLHHRNPSLLGASLELKCIKEAICDGVHLSDGIIRMLFNHYSNEICIISDSVSACGLNDGTYKLGGLDVIVKNNKATLPDGTIAGSCKNIYEQFKYCLSLGISYDLLINSITRIPYTALNLPEKNLDNLEDFILFNSKFDIVGVWKNGNKI